MIKYEKEMYKPVKEMFEAMGYEVKGEVKDCDLMAVKDNEVIICELKLKFNLKLIYQLMDRKNISPVVYGVILTPDKDRYNIIKLMKALDMGLIFVSETTGIPDIIITSPKTGAYYNKQFKNTVSEFKKRHYDNTGGMRRTKLMTAYKEQSIQLLCYIEALNEVKPRTLKEIGLGENVRNILYNNYYGWFINIKRGVYGLSNKGKEALKSNEYSKQVEFFRREMEDKNVQVIEK